MITYQHNFVFLKKYFRTNTGDEKKVLICGKITKIYLIKDMNRIFPNPTLFFYIFKSGKWG